LADIVEAKDVQVTSDHFYSLSAIADLISGNVVFARTGQADAYFLAPGLISQQIVLHAVSHLDSIVIIQDLVGLDNALKRSIQPYANFISLQRVSVQAIPSRIPGSYAVFAIVHITEGYVIFVRVFQQNAQLAFAYFVSDQAILARRIEVYAQAIIAGDDVLLQYVAMCFLKDYVHIVLA
jgi:hypothetical protein